MREHHELSASTARAVLAILGARSHCDSDTAFGVIAKP